MGILNDHKDRKIKELVDENERLRAEIEYLEGMIDRVRELVCDHRVSDIRESENEKVAAWFEKHRWPVMDKALKGGDDGNE